MAHRAGKQLRGISPAKVLEEVARAVPDDCRSNIVVIGSLAAAYHFLRDSKQGSVRTKDIDCLLEPFSAAVGAGREIVRKLLDEGWHQKNDGGQRPPGTESTRDDELPAIRLYPPGVELDHPDAWFIELLTVPNPAAERLRAWIRLELKEGHFGLPSFRFLSLAACEPLLADNLGLRYARPEMLALANLLEHPGIGKARMTGLIGARSIKRSNKDLGRVLAIGILAGLDDFRPWARRWLSALEACFPKESCTLARSAGTGLSDLLASSDDLDEAHHTCAYGLLAAEPPTREMLSATGDRLLEAIEFLEKLATEAGSGSS